MYFQGKEDGGKTKNGEEIEKRRREREKHAGSTSFGRRWGWVANALTWREVLPALHQLPPRMQLVFLCEKASTAKYLSLRCLSSSRRHAVPWLRAPRPALSRSLPVTGLEARLGKTATRHTIQRKTPYSQNQYTELSGQHNSASASAVVSPPFTHWFPPSFYPPPPPTTPPLCFCRLLLRSEVYIFCHPFKILFLLVTC